MNAENKIQQRIFSPYLNKLLYKICFGFIQPREDCVDKDIDPICAIFPMLFRNNADQVPHIFVNGQDIKFKTEYYNNVNIKIPDELLRKYPFTTHLLYNSGAGYDAHGWFDILCKENGKIIP